MPLTKEQGYKIREEYSDIKEKAICDAHGLTQIGGSRTKVDGTDGNVSKSIKNASGSSTQVHLTTKKHFKNTLNIKGNAAEFIEHFCGSSDYDYNGLETHVPIKETGVWVKDKKIASIGIHVSRGVTIHGLAININTDLSYFDNIISCGIEGVKMTTIDKELGKKIAMNDIKKQLISNFNKIFNT